MVRKEDREKQVSKKGQEREGWRRRRKEDDGKIEETRQQGRVVEKEK